MFIQRQNNPITKMLVKSDQNSIFSDGFLQYILIVCSILTNFRSAHNIITFIAQSLRHSQFKHLNPNKVLAAQA